MFTQEQGKKPTPSKPKPYSFRLTDEEKAIVTRAAQAEHRDFSSYVRHQVVIQARESLGLAESVSAS